MADFFFADLLERRGVEPRAVRLLRHDGRGAAAWMRGGRDALGCFASFQSVRSRPYNGARLACQFLPGPALPGGDASALFVGMTEVLDRWAWDGDRLPAIRDDLVIEAERGQAGLEAFDLRWREDVSDLCQRVLIRWGQGTRSWSQWADRQPKEIVEVRRAAVEAPFPGFGQFSEMISALAARPESWRNVLRSVGGVYLLVAEDGAQYVGSATGADGFWGRWAQYAADGHGGNARLRTRGARDYRVSVLEIASPGMTQAEVVAREAHWKDRLGSRAHGLNAN